MDFTLSADESKRLLTLQFYQILDTLPEQAYDDIVTIASEICETPIALISFVEAERQWFKAKIGLEENETARDVSFCAHALADPEELFIVTNAENDRRFADNPLVTNEPRIRFYAGAPLVAETGEALGTLCVIDCKPRHLTENQKNVLRALARQVMAQLELRRKTLDLERNAELHRQTQLRLRLSEERFRAFMSNSPTVAFMKDEAGVYVYLNEMLEKSFEVSRDFLLGKTDFDWLPLETAAAVTENDRFVLETNQPIERLEIVTTPNGDCSHWLSFKFPFVDSAKKRFVGGISLDVTQRVKAEAALKASENRYRHLVENSLAFICTHDFDGRILSINGSAAESLGYEAAEIVGKNLRELITSEAREKFDAYLRRIRHYKMDEGAMSVETKHGQKRIWQYHNRVYKADGEQPYVIGSAQDVTEMHVAQQRLRDLSLKDDLTGLYNRRGFYLMAEQTLKIARRAGRECLLVYADLDGLKRVNDTLGHEIGSEMIHCAAKFLKTAFVRESDLVARLGGDEFAVLSSEVSLNDESETIVRRLQSGIENFNRTNRFPFQLSISFGIVKIAPDGENSLADYLQRADEQMYRYKKNKRQSVSETIAVGI